MKIINNSIRLAAIIIALNCTSSLGESLFHKKPTKKEAKNIGVKPSSKDIIMHHLTSFQNNDLEAVVRDYTDESVLITQNETYKGIKAIRQFFTGLMKYFPKQKSSFDLDKIVVNDGLVYIVWHAKTPSLTIGLGSDTFVIKDGKIFQQTYVKSNTP